MSRIFSSNRTVAYIIAVVVVIVAFLLLGGKNWMAGNMQGGGSIGNLNWVQILIGFVLGFLLGVVVSKRRRKWL
jgi:membrane associated rhomboid family serine protease